MIHKAFYTSVIFFTLISCSVVIAQETEFTGWETDLTQKNIDLDELRSGGPGKDGIPSIDNPAFINPSEAVWLNDKEPVIALEYRGEARAYPLQILIWHEIVNDVIEDKPVLITFCPLCYSAIVFSRTVKDEKLSFGVSGFLRHSDMVMYDRATESLWQQFNGKAIVGDYIGTKLEQLPSQLISFAQFKKAYPQGTVLSRDTGHRRNYGQNPYQGYDDIDNSPFMLDEKARDDRMRPMMKVVGIKTGGRTKAYPYSITQKKHVINDSLGGQKVVIFHTGGAASALDASSIADSKEAGSTGAFRPLADGKELTFEFKNEEITDLETGSRWDITGKCVAGPLEGAQLESLESGDYFAFAWLVFYPETEIYSK